MSLTKDEALQKINKAYFSSHNIQSHDENAEGLVMEAEFHVHSENYVISKKAQIYQMDSNEYVYIFYVPHLTLDIFNKTVAEAYDLGFPRIEPNSSHRSSYVVTEIICDTYDEDALKALKKYRKRKSFQFSLQGWMECHTVMIDLGTESVYSNGDGRLTGKFLKNVLHPRKRMGLRLFK